MADQTSPPRLLILDDGIESIVARGAGQPISLVAAVINEDITLSLAHGGYKASQRLLDLARTASSADYDYVFIGNNLGLGLTLAKMVSSELRPRTLIVWNDQPGDHDTWEYRELGYQHFGTRVAAGRWLNEQLSRR